MPSLQLVSGNHLIILASMLGGFGEGGEDEAELAELSSLLALEGLPLHLSHFPKLWTNLHNRNKEVRVPLLEPIAQLS